MISASTQETETLATEMATVIPEDQILALYGELGAGKTTFVRGLARAWRIIDPVTSPSYNILAIYRGERTLLHLDAYRLESEKQIEDLMLEEFFTSPYCLAIEWPENLGDWLSPHCWKLRLENHDENHRFIQLV